MTIQKLGTTPNPTSHFPLESLSRPVPNTPQFFFNNQDQTDHLRSSSVIWFKLGCIALAGIGIVATANYVFMKYLKISRAPVIKLKKNHDEESFVGKLLNEARETTKANCIHLMARGDGAFEDGRLDEAEKCYAEALKTISLKDDNSGAICAKKLGALYLVRAKKDGPIEDRKEDCMKSAGLLNFGLSLAYGQNAYGLQKEIREELINVEGFLYALCGVKELPDENFFWDTENKCKLKEIRKSIQNKLIVSCTCPADVKKLFQWITTEMKSFIASLIQQSLEILGKPPHSCKFAVIGLGSMARGEMTPFSDVEFSILIEEGKDKEDVEQYFRNLTHLIHLRVLNLRETIVPILGIRALDGFYDDITLRGFSFDGKGSLGRGYKTPLGKKGAYELIQTAKRMAQFQGKIGDEYWYEREPLLPTELHNVTYIYGKQELVESYRRELNIALSKESRDGSSLKTYYAQKHLLSEDVTDYGIDFDAKKVGMLFELKKDLYRIPHLFIERLFLNECENLPEDESIEGTFSKIDWLVGRNKLRLVGAFNLKWMFVRILLARLKKCYKTNSAKSIGDPTTGASSDVDDKICTISFLFCEEVKDSFKNRTSLQERSFYSENLRLRALLKMRFGRYTEANEYILKHLEKEPSDLTAQMLSLLISVELGDEETGRITCDKIAKMIQELGPEKKSLKAFHLAALGSFHRRLGDVEQGIQIVEEAYEPFRDDPNSVTLYKSTSDDFNYHIKNGDFMKAQEVLEKTRQALMNRSSEVNSRFYTGSLISCLFNLSFVHSIQHHVKESIKIAEECLGLAFSFYGRRHNKIAKILNALGLFFFSGGAHETGICYLQKSLEITAERFGEWHAVTIEEYLELQGFLNKIDPKKGLDLAGYLERAEKIKTKNPNFLCRIANAWMRIYKYERAENILLQAVELSKERGFQSCLATSYNSLVKLYELCGRDFKALWYAQLALEEHRKLAKGNPSAGLVIALSNLALFKTLQLEKGFVLDKITNKKLIIKVLQEAEAMSIEIGKTADANEPLSIVYKRWGIFEHMINKDEVKALSYFSKSLSLAEDLYGPESPNIVEALGYTCQSYFFLPVKEDASIAFFRRFLYLSEKHCGPSSREYKTACYYCDKYGK